VRAEEAIASFTQTSGYTSSTHDKIVKRGEAFAARAFETMSETMYTDMMIRALSGKWVILPTTMYYQHEVALFSFMCVLLLSWLLFHMKDIVAWTVSFIGWLGHFYFDFMETPVPPILSACIVCYLSFIIA
jgi:hypothetical protein